jgi:DNA-binding CsgD family transcriptional regulator
MSGQEAALRARPAQQVVPSLGRWGLSPHADLVYRTLVLTGAQTSHQLARHLGVDPGRVRRALDELANAGSARPSGSGGVRQWVPTDPGRLLAVMRQRHAPMKIDARYRGHLAAVAGLHLERIPADGIRRIPSRTSTRDRIAALVTAERHEHLVINTEEVFTADAAQAAAPLDQSLVNRGIRVRSLGLPAQDGSTSAAPPTPIERRVAAGLPLKLMVFDRRSAVFPADPVNFDAGSIEIVDPDTVAHLTQLFHALWRNADDPRHGEVPTIVLTGREQNIVELLIAGASEQSVAAELGLSRRTVVYTLRALMDRIGVENRFQLAMILGAARAVPLPPLKSAMSSQES